MRPCFSGLGALALAATPLAAIPLALPSSPAQAHPELTEPEGALRQSGHPTAPRASTPLTRR